MAVGVVGIDVMEVVVWDLLVIELVVIGELVTGSVDDTVDVTVVPLVVVVVDGDGVDVVITLSQYLPAMHVRLMKRIPKQLLTHRVLFIVMIGCSSYQSSFVQLGRNYNWTQVHCELLFEGKCHILHL